MQEEVTQRTVALCVEATKLSAGMLQQAMKKVLDEMQKGVTGHKTKLHHGKQTLRQLMKHNTGVSNIEITDQNIRAFSATAKKYGIDFALKKDTSGEIPRYLVFFKGRDADVITAAFREFSAKNLEKEKKPSIRKELEQAKQQVKAQHHQREKVKTKDRGVKFGSARWGTAADIASLCRSGSRLEHPSDPDRKAHYVQPPEKPQVRP